MCCGAYWVLQKGDCDGGGNGDDDDDDDDDAYDDDDDDDDDDNGGYIPFPTTINPPSPLGHMERRAYSQRHITGKRNRKP